MTLTMTEPTPPSDSRGSLIGADHDALGAILAAAPFRAQQAFRWIYHNGVRDIAAMTTLGRDVRARLAHGYTLARPDGAAAQESSDGTRKGLLRYADGQEAETVFIPDDDRGTLCVSSQVGCTLTCPFCHTGSQRLVRNLTAAEIVAQAMLARDVLDDWPASRPQRRITNIVFMGMGEPLYNTDNVIAAIRLLTDGGGLSWSRRRITLSTSGVVPEMTRVGRETGVKLAVSLHAAHDDLRNVLVPINRRYPLEALLRAVRAWPGLGNAKRVTWEYVMLKDVNDSEADARALLRLIEGIPSKINLLPFNPWPGSSYVCSDDATIERFAAILWRAGYASPVRTPRGRDILAACGQLKSASLHPKPLRAAAASRFAAAQ